MFQGCTGLTAAPTTLPATTLANSCYYQMFKSCTSLTTSPVLPATILASNCYYGMFDSCSNLETIPSLPAITLQATCYAQMFQYCPKVKFSATQTGDYVTAYRIPTTGTGTTATNAMQYMLRNTGGTFKQAPTINITYYTSNTVVNPQ